mmetsp:Transcript_13493/g.30559  ORF Transcript_13493/g.30559 Transcript_13493/m.30559 type:complete len:221 (+) Transcript_13493:167-829(+)
MLEQQLNYLWLLATIPEGSDVKCCPAMVVANLDEVKLLHHHFGVLEQSDDRRDLVGVNRGMQRTSALRLADHRVRAAIKNKFHEVGLPVLRGNVQRSLLVQEALVVHVSSWLAADVQHLPRQHFGAVAKSCDSEQRREASLRVFDEDRLLLRHHLIDQGVHRGDIPAPRILEQPSLQAVLRLRLQSDCLVPLDHHLLRLGRGLRRGLVDNVQMVRHLERF